MSVIPNNPASKSSLYETPYEFVLRVGLRLGAAFSIDVCATEKTAKAPVYFGPDHAVDLFRDALVLDWTLEFMDSGVACTPYLWMNPPYGRGINKWTELAVTCSADITTIVGLLPGNAWDTAWWHRDVMGKAHEIIPIRGRIKFLLDGVVQGSPANGNILVVWRPGVPPAMPTLMEAMEAE